MAFTISGGPIETAKKVVIYGPEGIGKTLFAAKFPDPVFIDTEHSTDAYNVRRLPAPSSWQILLDEVRYIRDTPGQCKTLVIDTADWAEKLCVTELLATSKKSGIEDFGYGKGYTYAAEKFAPLLTMLEEVKQRGIHIVVTAHAMMRKFEQPDEMGSYDRWELKLSKQIYPMLKEWADMILFANYKTMLVSDQSGKKKKAQGGQRVMYTAHHPCWDAKNRYDLPEELPLDFGEIAHLFGGSEPTQAPVQAPDRNPVESIMEKAKAAGVPAEEKKTEWLYEEPDQRVPKKLRDLMIAGAITEEDVEWAVTERGYFPAGMKIWEYDPEFVDAVLVGAWEQVHGMIIARGPRK